jgi:putative ABC transport system substrate-binding protein
MSPQLGAKRFELLKEVFPRMSRVAVVIRSANLHREAAVREMEYAAQCLGVQVQIVAVQEANEIEIERIFALITRKRVQAFILIPTPTFTYYRKLIVELASKSRLPAIYPNGGYVEAGGLMSYAANNADLYRRAASFVDKILKGAKPADLPVEQPTKFELVINLKTAKQLNLTIPPKVLMWADRVLE